MCGGRRNAAVGGGNTTFRSLHARLEAANPEKGLGTVVEQGARKALVPRLGPVPRIPQNLIRERRQGRRSQRGANLLFFNQRNPPKIAENRLYSSVYIVQTCPRLNLIHPCVLTPASSSSSSCINFRLPQRGAPALTSPLDVVPSTPPPSARGSTHTRHDGLRVAPRTSPRHARSTSVASVGRPAVLPCSAKPCRYESPS